MSGFGSWESCSRPSDTPQRTHEDERSCCFTHVDAVMEISSKPPNVIILHITILGQGITYTMPLPMTQAAQENLKKCNHVKDGAYR
jgi:hypothetical protein